MDALPGSIGPGMVLSDRYRIERILGRGTMGVVVAATQLGIERLVAIKLMSSAASAEGAARLLREARVAALLKSAHAGKVLDVGTLPDGAPFLVLEYLDGEDLAALVARRGPLPVAEAVSLVLQACEAVAEAHALGIVHRDLKPANLFLSTGPGGAPCVKVLDFGISRLGDADAALTGTGQMLGSPRYMSPEQFNSSRDVDARGDVWALGVILYELLAAAPPFDAQKLWELCMKVCSAPPRPLSDIRPDVPSGLCAVIGQCLEKEVDRRWPSVAAFAAALAPFAAAGDAGYVDRIARAQRVEVRPAIITSALPPGLVSIDGAVRGPSSFRTTARMSAPVAITSPLSASERQGAAITSPLSASEPLASAATISPRRAAAFLSAPGTATVASALAAGAALLSLIGFHLWFPVPTVTQAASGEAVLSRAPAPAATITTLPTDDGGSLEPDPASTTSPAVPVAATASVMATAAPAAPGSSAPTAGAVSSAPAAPGMAAPGARAAAAAAPVTPPVVIRTKAPPPWAGSRR